MIDWMGKDSHSFELSVKPNEIMLYFCGGKN